MTKVQPIANTTQSGKWKTYPAYKDSGVEWLGEIPEHWEVARLKQVFKVVNGATPKSSEPIFWDGDIPWVTPEDLGSLRRERTIAFTSRMITEEGYQNCGTTLVPEGTLILSTRAPIGHLAIASIALCTNQGCRSLVFRKNYDVAFFFYQLKVAKQELQSWGQGSTFLELAKSKLEVIKLPIPPLTEQRTIAAFLDHETARSNVLIAKKERMIELLREKRTALISHAVTKGLDPTVKMKDSGVEWIGKIPEHWEVKKLKFVADVLNGVAKGRDLGQKDIVEFPYLRVANVQDGYLDLSDIATITVGVDEVERYSLRYGDVLMNEGGDFDKLGRGYVWDNSIVPCLHQNHVFAVRPHSGINPYWITTVTQSSYAKHYFILKSKQSTNLASISATNLKELLVLMPPKDEQNTILAFIENSTAKIDALITRIGEGIEKLKEYSTALISEAVTGKIDVRGEIDNLKD